MSNLKGVGVALVTPFNEDLSVDFDSLTKLVDYNIENGTNYLVVLGTTAEAATLSAEEKTRLQTTSSRLIINVFRLFWVLAETTQWK